MKRGKVTSHGFWDPDKLSGISLRVEEATIPGNCSFNGLKDLLGCCERLGISSLKFQELQYLVWSSNLAQGFKAWRDSLSMLMCWRVAKVVRTSQMLHINVALPNGHAELLSLLPSSTVQDLRTKARVFGRKCLRLITAKNLVLVDPDKTMEETEIEGGECLTALVPQPQLAATGNAFALWCHWDSAIVTWGDHRYGGDSSEVRDQLKGVQQIQAAALGAFAAILADGSVITSKASHPCGNQLLGYGSANHGVESAEGVLGYHHWLCSSSHGCKTSCHCLCRFLFFSLSPARCQFLHHVLNLHLAGEKEMMHTVVVTVRKFDISWRVCSRFKPLLWGPLLRFWQMDQSLPGVLQALVETVWQFEISWSGCAADSSCCFGSRFKPQILHLLRFWQDPSFLGVMHTVVVKGNSGLSSLVVYAEWQGPSCRLGSSCSAVTPSWMGWWRKRAAIPLPPAATKCFVWTYDHLAHHSARMRHQLLHHETLEQVKLGVIHASCWLCRVSPSARSAQWFNCFKGALFWVCRLQLLTTWEKEYQRTRIWCASHSCTLAFLLPPATAPCMNESALLNERLPPIWLF